MSLRLAVDARNIATDNQGIGRYSRAILRRLIARDDVDLTLLLFGPFAFRHRRQMEATLGSGRFRIATRARDCDVVWHPGNGTFFASSAPSVVSMHDAMPFIYPHPDPKRRDHQQAPFLRSVREAKRFITVSRFAREEIRGVFDLPADRFDVIYHGVESDFTPGNTGEPPLGSEPFFLFVGDTNQEPPKNFPLLYDAFRKAFPAGGVQLAVAGPTDPKLDGVRYLGVLNGDAQGGGDARLRDIYRAASAVCVPSYHETFGMPLLEAMACGTPVIAAHATALPEVGGDAAIYAAPHDVFAWSVALRQVFEDRALRTRLREAGIERARAFTWEASAAMHVEVFRRA